MPKSDGYKNLRDRSAPDKPGQDGDPVVVPARLSPDDAAWLKSQPEGASYHIRQAVKLYRASKK